VDGPFNRERHGLSKAERRLSADIHGNEMVLIVVMVKELLSVG
jgi:hypothetical protein